VEAYTCLGKNPLSDGAALTATELISRHLLQVVHRPDDRQGRLAVATAAVLAGAAFSNSMTGMAHALGHAMGGICGVPHGACMAIFLPYALEYNRHRNGEFTAELLLPLAGPEVFARTPKHRRADEVVAAIRQLNQGLHDATGGRHARFLSELKDAAGNPLVYREQIEAVAAAAVSEAPVHYNPEELDRGDCRMVLEAAWEGNPLAPDGIRRS
jgi:alcohol dehydrogenase